jgi:hypothetical protein
MSNTLKCEWPLKYCAPIQITYLNINYFLSAAASGAGTTGASIVAGAGLPAKADAAAIANAVARAIFFILLPPMWRNVFVSWDTIFCGPHAYIIC